MSLKRTILLTTLLGLAVSLTAAAAPEEEPTSSPKYTEYDLQALVWEHNLLFNEVLEWAKSTNVLTARQVQILQHELETRLQAFAENEGSDVLGTIDHNFTHSTHTTHYMPICSP